MTPKKIPAFMKSEKALREFVEFTLYTYTENLALEDAKMVLGYVYGKLDCAFKSFTVRVYETELRDRHLSCPPSDNHYSKVCTRKNLLSCSPRAFHVSFSGCDKEDVICVHTVSDTAIEISTHKIGECPLSFYKVIPLHE